MIKDILLYTICGGYGGLMLFVSVLQMKKKTLPIKNIVFMVLGSISLIVSMFFVKSNTNIFICLLGLVSLHIGAIMNGISIHGKVNMKHHFTRFGLSAIILFLYIIVI